MNNIKFLIYGAILLALMAGGPLFGQDAEVEVLTRLKFGWKTFTSFLQDANEHEMIGFEAEVRWPEAGAEEGSFQGLSLILGLEDSSGDGPFSLGAPPGINLDLDVLEVDLGVRYTVTTGSIRLYGGVGLAFLDGDAQTAGNPKQSFDGEGLYVEVGGYTEMPVNDESTMTFVLGLGLKLVNADVDFPGASFDIGMDPVSYQFFAGLKF